MNTINKLKFAAWFICVFTIVSILIWAPAIIVNKYEYKKTNSAVCYADQQVKEECFPPGLPKFIITTKIYIESDTGYFEVAKWEDVVLEENLDQVKQTRLNEANDLRFQTNMKIITGKIHK